MWVMVPRILGALEMIRHISVHDHTNATRFFRLFSLMPPQLLKLLISSIKIVHQRCSSSSYNTVIDNHYYPPSLSSFDLIHHHHHSSCNITSYLLNDRREPNMPS